MSTLTILATIRLFETIKMATVNYKLLMEKVNFWSIIILVKVISIVHEILRSGQQYRIKIIKPNIIFKQGTYRLTTLVSLIRSMPFSRSVGARMVVARNIFMYLSWAFGSLRICFDSGEVRRGNVCVCWCWLGLLFLLCSPCSRSICMELVQR